VEVVITDEARDYVAARGGAVFVTVRERSCCSGALVLLNASTDAPPDAGAYASYGGGGIQVFYRGNPRGVPSELVIELHGRRRPRLAAFKNGCAYST
jgi:hypothetical protein